MNARTKSISLATMLLLACSPNQPVEPEDATTDGVAATDVGSANATDGRSNDSDNVAPGPITDFLSFHESSADTWEQVLDRCTIGGQAAQIVIAEATDSGTRRQKECSDDMVTPGYTEFQMTVLKPIVGTVPKDFLMTAGLADVLLGPVEKGTRLLLSMREWRGVYVPVHSVQISFEPDETAAQMHSSAEWVELPTEVATLVTAIQDGQSDPDCASSDRSVLLEEDDAYFDEAIAPDRICDDTD